MRSSSTCRRPAVSTMTTLRPRRAASSSDVRATATGRSGTPSPAACTGTSRRRPRTRSCSTAAGRCRSAATSSTPRPWLLRWRASFPAAVVFPEPCSPASITTVGGFELIVSLPVVPPSVVTSSSCTILMTCCAGVRLLATSAPFARSLIRLMNARTTRTFTSASSSARRISRATSSTSSSLRRPRPRRRVKIESKRSERASNMRQVPGRGNRDATGRQRRACERARTFSPEQRVDELDRVERDEVRGGLADADDLDRDAELGLDREDDAALRAAIELRQHDAGDVDRLGELARLDQPVLTGRRVDHEQDLLQRAGRPLDDAPELLQLLHQVDLRVEPPRGVDEHEVGVTARRRAHRVEHDRARVRALLPAHELRADAAGPRGELLRGRGAERVRRGEDDTLAVVDLVLRELGDRRRLPHAVHADEHLHARGAVGGRSQRAIRGLQHRDQLGAQQLEQLRGVGDLHLLRALAQLLEDPRGGRHADVGQQQALLQLVPDLVVDVAPAGQVAEEAAERGTRAAEPVAQARLDGRRGSGRGRGRRRGRRRRRFRDRDRRLPGRRLGDRRRGRALRASGGSAGARAYRRCGPRGRGDGPLPARLGLGPGRALDGDPELLADLARSPLRASRQPDPEPGEQEPEHDDGEDDDERGHERSILRGAAGQLGCSSCGPAVVEVVGDATMPAARNAFVTRARSSRATRHCSSGRVLATSRMTTFSGLTSSTPQTSGSSITSGPNVGSRQTVSAVSWMTWLARAMSASAGSLRSSSARDHCCDLLPTRVIVPFGTCQTTPSTSRRRVVRRLMPSTVPVATPASITSPTPYWSSASMKMPLRKSRTRLCAPKPIATPTIPAPATIGPRATPSASSTLMSAIAHTTTATMLASSAPIVSARCARRTFGIGPVSSQDNPARRRSELMRSSA